jgi:hypothetical protein
MNTPGRVDVGGIFWEWAGLAALMFGFSLLFAAFYPPISGVEDETGFLNQALVWSRGAVSAQGAGYADGLPDFILVNGRHVPSRHPGRSLLALPFLMAGGARATFASGLLIHLATTLVAAALFARLERSPLWAVLVLFHPTLALYSRTIMADGAAGAGLLLAALAVVSGRPIAAGLAVGLAASMRYHSALALPLVAASFFLQSPRRWRDTSLCLLAGGLVGCGLVAYNLAVYGSPNEPFTARRGYFSAAFVIPNAAFYASALMAVWPGMLLAPALDRSPLRWLNRGVIVLFLGPLLFYYFHDVAEGQVQTWIVGQRLIQVALPLWVVSYSGVLDDWLMRPIRERMNPRLVRLGIALGCLGLLTATGLMFARHQHYLKGLRQARDELVARMPSGSLVVYQGSLVKLIGTPVDVPAYRFRQLLFEGKPVDDPTVLKRDLERERRPWFLGLFHRSPGEPEGDYARSLVESFGLERVAVDSPLVTLYVARP